MKSQLHLLVIDPQNDFCDLPANYCHDGLLAPALPVAGAHADMQRLAQLISEGMRGIAGITVTLDSHHRLDIAHPTFWAKADGGTVSPFTEIVAADVRAGRYVPRIPNALPQVLAYLDALESSGSYRLMVWPVHCEIGSWGHGVHADVRAAYNRWEDATCGIVNKVTKGSNPWTEHYSAVMAEVPDPSDPHTQMNQSLVESLRKADKVFITGEAGSHCVKATTEHLAWQFGSQDVSKLVLVTDCMSPVAGFESQYESFTRDMVARGVQLATSADVLPELLANATR
jgi:nicotinamidase-related amidase